jgi:hypothetical protein
VALGASPLVRLRSREHRRAFWLHGDGGLFSHPQTAALRLTADKSVIKGTDALDDAQVGITVVDARGQAVSDSPEVTLTIESGPGELPTGPSITFGPRSDIAIRDGQAAIAFRSYHGGETLLRARSPGLEDGMLTITTEGSPGFVRGETPSVAARPYVRFARPTLAAPEIALGRDAPARASGEAPGHPACAANDGDGDTFWAADDRAVGAWWEMDLERLCVLTHATVTLPFAGPYRYRIEASDDREAWRVAVDESQTLDQGRTRSHACAAGTTGRFVRVTFTGLPEKLPAGISDLGVMGRVRSE